VVGDNITVTGMANAAYNDAWARVDIASAKSFSYDVLTTASASGDTSSGGKIIRADRYSLALAAATTYFYRIGGPSNSCGASPATGQFTTMNIPNGNTWAEGPLLDPATQNQLFPSIFNDRTTYYVDPLTGAQVKRLGLYGDGGIGGGSGISAPWTNGSAAGFRSCSLSTSNGGYHCWVGQGESYVGGLYWINGSTGEVRFLGLMNNTFTDNAGHTSIGTFSSQSSTNGATGLPNRFYATQSTNFGNRPYKQVLGYVDYTGNDVAVPTGQPNGTLWTVADPGAPWDTNGGVLKPLTLPPSNTLSDMMDLCVRSNTPSGACQQDSTFTAAKFAGCEVDEVVGDYIKLGCNGFQQDSVAWYFVYRISTSTIVAGGSSYSNPTTRWCGNHGALPDNSASWISAGTSNPGLNGAQAGEYEVSLTAPVTGGSTSFTVTGAVDGTIGEPQNPFPFTDANGNTWNYLQPAQGANAGGPGGLSGGNLNGDLFIFDDPANGDEIVRLVSKGSCSGSTCTWQAVARGLVIQGVGAPAASHPVGTHLAAICEPYYRQRGGIMWNFINDPTRADITGTNVFGIGQNLSGFSTGHSAVREPNDVNDSDVFLASPDWTGTFSATVLADTQPSFNLDTMLPFAGLDTDSGGVGSQNYLNWDFENASFKDSYLLNLEFLGGQGFGTGYTNVTGNIWKFSNGTDVPFHPELPYFSMQGLKMGKNISGPDSLLPNTGSGEYCVAMNTGECWAGSNPGNVYADFTTMDGPAPYQCRLAGENSGYTGHDWCMVNPSTYGNSLSQMGYIKGNTISIDPRGVPVSDSANSRRLVQWMSGGWRLNATYLHTIPDGSFETFESCVGDPHINVNGTNDGGGVSDVYACGEFMVKIPPQPPADGIDRTNYENVTVTIGAGSGGATHARVKYGYTENETVRGTTWPPVMHFYCTQYQGTCYSSNQNLPLNSQQILPIGVPQRVLFYEVEYLNSLNQVVASDFMTAAAIP